MKKRLLSLTLLAIVSIGVATAQRTTDYLDRGLVAIPTGSTSGSTSNLVTWRRLAGEYFDVKYNLYKNGSKVASNLTTTCYNDSKSATSTTKYQVAAVVNGEEQEKCDAVTPWTQYVYKYDVRCPTGYIDIPLATVYDRDGNDVTDHYEPNDAEMADLDGDGQLEIIVKRLNTVDAAGIYLASSKEFVVIDAYDVNWQTGAATLMWRIDCGPNMASLNSTEINIIAYDWNGDGCAEVVMRGADNMIVYGTDGKTQLFTVGNMSVNTRNKMTSHTDSQYAWTHTGNEYLIYMDGQTGEKYQVTTYPLKRLETGESSEKTAWGDDYGHRSTKHFMGAPFLDGRTPSLFLARGIYTRHKMIAMSLNGNEWVENWRWNNNTKGSPWYGQGNHNFVIADVDEDGRDEIVYGSMVIDDNGMGLSTTGLGHGDAIHVGDFDPYRKGLEVFACNEEKPNMNYRNATTSEIYFRSVGSEDDGRCLMDNFSNDYPGSVGRSVNTGMISAVKDTEISALGDYIAWGDLNFRIYWDGDLCSEVLNSPGTAKEAKIEKPGTGRLFTSSGCNMNNDSKNNPCFQGDIIGDWREEIVVRCGTGLRVYTTGMYTEYSMPSLWFDHQYRQAMVWQMMAYNQPPHVSYFLGEMEGITVAPPPLTMDGRSEVTGGGTISNSGEQVLIADQGDITVEVADGAAPSVLIVNTPTWVQGSDDNANITTDTYTHTLTGGAFTGTMRLVKQGNGTLVLPNVTEDYSGNTDVWGGTLRFDGTLTKSPLWLNRHTTLISDGGTFSAGITADYNAQLIPGGEDAQGTITTNILTLNHGARLLLDIFDDITADQINVTQQLTIGTKTGDPWTSYGPKYLRPVVEVADHSGIENGTFDLGTINSIKGSVNDLELEGIGNAKLAYHDGHLWLVVGTGELPKAPAANIAEKSMELTDEGIYLPVVDITVSAGGTTELTATFTDYHGQTEDVELTGSASSYAFSRPGTLTVTTASKGFTPTETTYLVDFVGVKTDDDGYTTLGCNYPLDMSDPAFTAYAISGQYGPYLLMTEAESAPAATGLLLTGEPQATYRLPVAKSAPAPISQNLLIAVTEPGGTTVEDGTYAYTLTMSIEGKPGFATSPTGQTLPAGTAYLVMDDNSREFYELDLAGEAVAISTLSPAGTGNAAVYVTLSGLRTTAPKKGVYIRANRKVVMK